MACPQAMWVPYISISPPVIHHSATIQGPAIVTLWSHTLLARHDRRWGGSHLKQLTCCQNILEGCSVDIMARVQTSRQTGHVIYIHLLFPSFVITEGCALCNNCWKCAHSRKFVFIQPSDYPHVSPMKLLFEFRWSLLYEKTPAVFGWTSF